MRSEVFSSSAPCTLPNHNIRTEYRPDIDGLRAAAILAVVIHHAFPTSLWGGFVGVDIFFVISGFLISDIIFRSLQRGDFSFVDFYSSRIRRIFPSLITVLIAVLLFGKYALLPDEFVQLSKHVAASAGFAQNFVLMKEAGYFDVATELKPLMHLWSLAVEEQFYLVYPLLIWFAWRQRISIIATVTVLALLSFYLNISGMKTEAVSTFFAPQTRFWEFLAGTALSYFQVCKHAQIKAWLASPIGFRYLNQSFNLANGPATLISWVGLLLIGASVLIIHKSVAFPGVWALPPVVGAALIILAGPKAWINRTFLANRLMVFVGLISYPLYLWHWPILSFVRIIESDTPSTEIQWLLVLASFLLAWLTYRLVERPIRFGGKTWVKTATLPMVLSTVGFGGYIASENVDRSIDLKMQYLSQIEWKYASNVECQKAYPNLTLIHCARSKNLKPTLLITGDSHSNSLYPGLAEITASTDEVILNLAGSGCVPFFDTHSFPRGAIDMCKDQTNQALEFALEHESIRTVILASRGPLYISGNGFRDIEKGPTYDRVLIYDGQPAEKEFARVFELGMHATLRRLTEQGKLVIFVLDVPELGFDPKSCVSIRPVRFRNSVRETCAVSRQDFEERNRDYRQIVRSVLKDYPNVKVFDAAEQLCDDSWCWAIKDGQLLYRDDDHLSLQGSRYIAERLLPVLKQ